MLCFHQLRISWITHKVLDRFPWNIVEGSGPSPMEGHITSRWHAHHYPGHTLTVSLSPCGLTDADALIVQFSRGVAEVSQSAVLAVLAPGVVFAADARDDVQVVDVAAAVGVAVALTVWNKRDGFKPFSLGRTVLHFYVNLEVLNVRKRVEGCLPSSRCVLTGVFSDGRKW